MTKKYSILYVDDEESNLRIFRTSFKRYYNVHIASSGQEGLAVLDEHPIDLILTDQKMPGMTGVEFLKQVITKYPDPSRIIVTGFSDTESIIEAINECGLYQYVTKPWKNEEMRFVIDGALEAYQMRINNKQLLEQLQEANEDLEKRVVERTLEVEAKNEELRKQHEKTSNSINYAKRIQTAILPTTENIEKHFPESFVLFQPKDVISGDFYWLGEVEGKIIYGAFDCTGHGVPGAFMTLIGSDLMNLITLVEGETDPSKILSTLHRQVVVQLKQGENNNQDGMDVAICVVDKDAGTLEFAGAKNSLVVLKDGEVEEYKGDKFPVGGTQYQSDRDFAKHCFQLNGDAQFYMFSDGYIDQFGGTEGRKFMRKRLKQLLKEVSHLPMRNQKEKLVQEFSDWMGNGQRQIDDVLVLGFVA